MTGITALLLFAAWTLLMMFTYVGYRVMMMGTGKPANSWTRGQAAPVPSFFTRAEHAHTNCVENLPVFAAVVLAASVLGKAPVADFAAPYVLAARVAQSIVHLIGISPTLVIIRATFFTIQTLLLFYMIWALVS